MGAPLVMLGLDGAAWPLIDTWATAGELPVLAALRAQGTLARIRCPEAYNDNAIWASFSTGRDPVNHGWMQYNRVRPGGHDVERVYRDSIDGTAFWQVASDAGRTVTVLDVPKSPRGRDLNGVELVDWLVHGADSSEPLSEPPGFVDEVVAAHGAGHPKVCLAYGRTGDELAAWLEARVDMVRRKGDLLVEQLAARSADLVVGVFNSTHCSGHQCWHLHDRDHPDFDPVMAERVGDPMLAVYRAVDREIGRVLDAAGPDATVIVFACLGMTTNFSGVGILEPALLGLDPRRPRTTLTPHGTTASAWRRLVPLRLRRAMPAAWHAAARQRGADLRARRSYWMVDCGGRTSGVRVNLAGREDGGVVPREDHAALLADLEAALGELVDADDGTPLVRAIERPQETHSGTYVGDLPDLFVHWTPRRNPVRAARSERLGEVVSAPPDRTGHHHAHGFALARGDGITAAATAPDVSITDLAPSILTRLGVPPPPADGHPIPALTASRSGY